MAYMVRLSLLPGELLIDIVTHPQIDGERPVETRIPNIDGLPAGQAALAIHKACGDQASRLVAEQIEQSDAGKHWRAIGAASTALTQAHHHMEIALDLLDAATASSVSAHLDAAISCLGVRGHAAVSVLIGEASGNQARLYYNERADQHLDLAARAHAPAVKGIHLDIASHYATLGQRAIEADRAMGAETETGPTP